MPSFLKVSLLGHLGSDPEIRYLQDGTPVCNFSVAVSEKKKDRSGNVQESVLWLKVNVWGKQGEMANQYLSKGSLVYVEGKLSQQQYTDREGNQRTSWEIRATDVQFLNRKESENQQPQARAARAPQASHQQRGFGKNDEDFVPF